MVSSVSLYWISFTWNNYLNSSYYVNLSDEKINCKQKLLNGISSTESFDSHNNILIIFLIEYYLLMI